MLLTFYDKFTRLQVEVFIGVIFFLASMFVGWAHIHHSSIAVGDIIRNTFPPAVNVACNGKLDGIDPSDYSPQLRNFLDQKVDNFDCKDLTTAPKPYSLDTAQYQTSHLLYVTGQTWKITGVSWRKLSPLLGILFGLTAIFTYGLFRLFMPREIAIPIASLAAFNPLSLAHLQYIRDYSKAPVLLGGLLILVMLVFRCKSARDIWKLSALMGAVIGIGLGFRQDALILIPMFFVILIFLTPKHPHMNIRVKCVAGMVFLAVLAGASYPVYPGYKQGSNSGHVILLGQTTPFEPANNINHGSDVSTYDIGHRYDDSLMSYLIRDYAYWNSGKNIDLYPNRDYERASLKYYVDLWRHFPADQIVRITGATLSISRLYMIAGYQGILHHDTLNKLRPVFMLYDRIAENLRGYPYLGLFVIGLSCLFLFIRNTKSAFLFVFSFIYFSAASSLQYDNRHVFYLQFYSWLSIGVILASIFSLFKCGYTGLVPVNKASSRSLLRGSTGLVPLINISVLKLFFHKSMAGIFAFIGLIGVGCIVFFGLRAYQSNHVKELMARYVNSPRTNLEGEIIDLGNGIVRYAPTELMPKLGEIGAAPWKASSSVYLVAEIDFRLCKTPKNSENSNAENTIIGRYESSGPAYDHSRPYSLPTHEQRDGQMAIFFPAFFHEGYSRFTGMDMSRSLLPCFKLKMVTDTSKLPMPLYITLLSDWMSHPPMKELSVTGAK